MQTNNHTIVLDTLHTVQHGVEAQIDETTRSNTRKTLLDSLYFPEIDERRSRIKEPAPSTLGWLFDSNYYLGPEPNPIWSDFKQWLCDKDTSTYWISGKAGSGKSTLMAHIVDDERTRRYLTTWSGNHKLEILSFFFWRAGSQLQHSIVGLLRSLLYQLCSRHTAIADTIVALLSTPELRIPIWTERFLLNHVFEAIHSSQGFRFCIFIDGLDEFDGSYDELLDSIEKLERSTNVKFCVSSRPELELLNRLRNLKQVRLQDININDIREFVGQSLRKTKLSEQLCVKFTDAIAWQAEGVFLWASLVTQSLIKGAKAGDNEELMQTRLRSLPKGINQLFQQLFSNIDPVYRKSLGFYVQLMNLMTEHKETSALIDVSIITTAQLQERKEQINTYEEFASSCERTETQIATQSAGLLEIYGDFRELYSKRDWDEAEMKYFSSKPRFTQPAPESLDRRRCSEHEPYPAMLGYQHRRMGWIHRSAFEFLKENPLLELSTDREVLFERIGESWIRYIAAAPSFFETPWPGSTSTRYRLTQIMNLALLWYDHYPKTASSLLDKVHRIYTQCDLDELRGAKCQSWFDPASGTYTGEIAFWSDCADLGLGRSSYMFSQVDRILADTAFDTVGAHLLAWSVELCDGGGPYIGDFAACLAEAMLKRIVQRSRTGDVGLSSKYHCISSADTSHRVRWGPFFWGSCFICASWKEPATSRSMKLMQSLIFILSRAFKNGFRSEHTLYYMPPSLPTFMDITDLFVAPAFVFNRICIQISAKTLLSAKYHNSTGDIIVNYGNLGSHIPANPTSRDVRILCVPSWKRHLVTPRDSVETVMHETYAFVSFDPVEWEPVTELEPSQFISIRPHPTTSHRLLGLIHYTLKTRAGEEYPRFGMIPNAQRQRKEVCDMLCQEIKSVEQGLDGGQQLIAAACIRAGLLDPAFDNV